MRSIGSAVELLPYGADRDDRQLWLAARQRGITASEISTILGLSRWNSPLSLYFEKLGALEDNEGTYRMRLGLELEPYILRLFGELTGLELSYAGLLSKQDEPWALATPDALAGLAPVEGKTSLSEENWGPSGSDEIPLYYRCQLLWQMFVIGSAHGYLCVVFMRSGEPRWYKLDWDGDDIGVMRHAAVEFLDRLERGLPPPADGHEATQHALRRMYPPKENVTATCNRLLVRQYTASLRRRREADQRHMLVTNKIREKMREATRLVDPDGNTVATRGEKGILRPGWKIMNDGKD